MNSSTQAMNNINKVQATNNGQKLKQGKEEPGVNFNDLFSSALGQSAPKAQLNSIENQLRESLYKQDKPRKFDDSTANTEAAQAAQAAVWAQRNWMQTAPVQETIPQTSAQNAEPVRQTSSSENTSRASEKTAEKAPENTTFSKAAPGDTSEDTDTSGATVKDSATEAKADTARMAASSSTQETQTPLASSTKGAVAQNTVPETTASLDAELTAGTSPRSSVEQNTLLEQPGQDKSRPEIKTTAQLKADTALANSSVQVRNESTTTSNTNTVAAQLAPQIAQQATGMTQGTPEAIGEEGLKVGQKILATGITAGTNGLSGAAAGAQHTVVKTPVNQPGFAKELGQTVQWAIGKNLSTVDIRVNPESFGPMNMRLVQKGQQIQLVIRTQDEASANLLTQALGGLKEVLAQNGLQLNQVQVQHGNTTNLQGQAHQGQADFDQNRGQGHGQHTAHDDNSQAEPATQATTNTARKPEGKLDLFA